MPDQYSTTQGRYLYLSTPLGEDKLQLIQIEGMEAMSELFQFQLEMEAKNDVDVKFEELIGKDISFGVNQGDYPARHFSGICNRISQGGRGSELTTYSMTVVPKVWKLTQTSRSRIFQQKSVQDILRTVLTGIDTDFQFEETYDPREYCVQYRETDWDFACRLMEDEGIYYYFKFSQGSHKLIVTDKKRLTVEVSDQPQVKFDTTGGGGSDLDMRISDYRRTQSWRTGKVTLWDHNFQLPHKHNDVEKKVVDTIHAGTITHKLKLNGNDAFELYESPGDYAKWFDGINKGGGEQDSELAKIGKHNKRVADVRMQQEETQMLLFEGASNCRHFVPGFKFTLTNHYNGNGDYIVTSVSHRAVEGSFRSGRSEASDYSNMFTCIPSELKFRAPRSTPKPQLNCQTAVVVGPSGEEIFTDKYGRVKVQFHWDRDGQNNESSSCWLRVATPWAGNQWGTIHIPRINMEVLVDFLEGDPDRPIIIGSLYNSREMPPYTLPDNKTQSGIKSRSSKGGGADNYNEIRFEDKKGEEMVTIHAEKDMEREVEHDDRIDIGNDQKINVHHDRTEVVDNDEKIEIKNNRTNKIGKDHTEEVGGNHAVNVSQGVKQKAGMNYAVEAGNNVTIKGGVNVNIEAGMMLTLKGSGGSISITPAGIVIMGTMVLINSGGAPPPPVVPLVIPPLMPSAPATPAVPGAPAAPAIPAAPALPDAGAVAAQATSIVNSSLTTASSTLGSMSNVFMDQVTGAVGNALNAAQAAGAVAASTAGAIANQIGAAVDEAKSAITDAVNAATETVSNAVNGVVDGAQQALADAAGQVADLQNQAAAALDNAQSQLQDAAAQAEQLANAAKEKAEQAMAEAAEQAANAAKQAQDVAAQAQNQLNDAAAQAQAIADEAKDQAQQQLNAASQKLDALAEQGQQAADAAQAAAANAAKEAQNMAATAMAQGEQAATQMANQAAQAAQAAQQQASQAASAAQSAAQDAAKNAESMAQQTQQQIDDATKQATQQVQDAAQQGQQQISDAANQATQQAAQAGQMAQQQASQVANTASNSASQAADQVGNSAGQAFNQVGNTANQTAQGMQNAFKGK